MPADPRTNLPAVDVLRVYDRDSLQRFLTAAEQECIRLRGLIDAARHRLRHAEATVMRSDALHERIGALVLDAHERVAEERRTLEQTTAALAESAEAEAERILAAARARAASLHGALERLQRTTPSAVPVPSPATLS